MGYTLPPPPPATQPAEAPAPGYCARPLLASASPRAPRPYRHLDRVAGLLLLLLLLIMAAAWTTRTTLVADGTTAACTQPVNFTGYMRVGSETPVTADSAGVVDTPLTFSAASISSGIYTESPLLLDIARGGTGATTAAGARSALAVLESPLAADTTTSVTGIWGIARGGTGRATGAIESPLALDTSTSITGLLPIAKGGTGATTAPGARSALGLAESATKTAGATGTVGQIAFDAGYLYYCTATDTWIRIAITAW
jgi:hypothetical protein